MNNRAPKQISAAEAERAESWLKLIERSRDRATAFPGKQCAPAAARPGQEPAVDLAVSERELEYLESRIEPGKAPVFVAEEVAELQGFGTSRSFSGTEITLLYRRRLYVRVEDGKVTQTTHCFQSMLARVATI
jgi:hypothetical protein